MDDTWDDMLNESLAAWDHMTRLEEELVFSVSV